MKFLSGIQPSGDMHLGNYFGMMQQMVNLQQEGELFAFIANYHALTSVSDGKFLKQSTLEASINFLSLGLDPEKSTFWVQSDVKEVLELYWILSNFTPMGLLERAHSYKDKTAKGVSANHGLFSYPVLMASDILIFDSNIVPVGKDQIQHVEMTRDIAIKFNNTYGEIFTIPEFRIDDNVATVPGVDGAKMSKSYKNTIEIFSSEKQLKKAVGKIVTDSTPLEEPKEWQDCNVFKISKLFLNENEQENLKDRYSSGKEGYGHFKMYLKDVIWKHFEPYREKRKYYLNNIDIVKDILSDGAKKASAIAQVKMGKVREVVGINY